MKNIVPISSIRELKKRLVELSHLSSALALLSWDQNVYLPPKGVGARAKTISELSSLLHNKFIAIDHDGLLSDLNKKMNPSSDVRRPKMERKLKKEDKVIVAEIWRSFGRAKKLPDAFVRELAEVTSKAQSVWAEAREKNNFKLFEPYLLKIVKLKRKEAEYVGYKKSPYDALLDAFEPGMSSEEAEKILNDLKNFLVPFLQKIKKAKIKIDKDIIKGDFSIEKQVEFNKMVASKIGFDFEAGRLDKTVHPFAVSFHPHDVRITTRYKKEDVLYSLGSTIHEAGHGLYEQGLPVEHFGTPLAECVSLGIHESQSRMWENIIGKSEDFWKYFYPKLQKEFPAPFKKIILKDFLKIINKIETSFIRAESDEVTYNLHIILRYEIEKGLIEGSIDVADLPEVWKSKIKEYLGIKVSKDSLGVLQDVHWSAGLFGYFPTYALGNLYASQFYSAMVRGISNISQKVAKGEFGEIKKWLRKNIHTHGKTYSASVLVKKVTGENLNSQYFVEYLEKKYKKLFNI